ncbi:hypothetical protein WJX72_009635 [[Myrmecia] bisecta]|uniref:FAD dependent oxidoreductase domain-containing protein n=1 Tax=[Myrmecia] bisecta TaxID=41462 RepID=A0AAW1PAR6_9CHLO
MLMQAAQSQGGRDAVKVGVLGAGVIGLSTALRLCQEVPGIDVTVIAEHFGSATTSDGAGGLWEPYKLGDTPGELINRWGGETFQHLQELYFSPEAADAGISMISAYQLWSEPHEEPVWRDIVPHFHPLSFAEMAPFEAAGRCRYAHGWCFTTLICQTRFYLPWLGAKLEAAGARLVERKLTSLQELAGYDVIVNCTGIGAAALFGDKGVYPVRGQVMRVAAPWVKSCYFVNEDNYIIPNLDTVVLGGTAQRGDHDTSVRAEDSRRIWEGTLRLMPSLAQAKVEHEWVGLRPGRDTIGDDVLAYIDGGLTVGKDIGFRCCASSDLYGSGSWVIVSALCPSGWTIQGLYM